MGLMTTSETTSGEPAAYTKAQAKAHDAKLAEATNALRAAMDRNDSASTAIRRAAGDEKRHRGGRRYASWGLTFEDAIAAARRIAAGDTDGLVNQAPWNVAKAPQRAVDALQARDTALAEMAEARATVAALDQVWRDNGRWSRFFVVPGGHIHRSTSCHSLRITTRIGWLPELSGESEAEAVSAHGAMLCSHCFPEAPVHWTTKAAPQVDPNECPGSRKYVPGANLRLYSPRGSCPECGKTVSVTKLGKARKH